MKKISNLLNTKTKKIVAIILVVAIIAAITIPCVVHFFGAENYSSLSQENKEQYYIEEFKENISDKDTLLVGTAVVDEETGETKMLASTSKNSEYTVFVDKNGKMTDTRYAVNVCKNVTKNIDGMLKEFLGDYTIEASLVINDLDECKLTEKSGFEDVQKTGGYNYNCQIFVNEEKRDEIAEEDIKWVFEKANLNAYIEVLFVPRIEGVPLTESPSTGATYTFFTERVDNSEK